MTWPDFFLPPRQPLTKGFQEDSGIRPTKASRNMLVVVQTGWRAFQSTLQTSRLSKYHLAESWPTGSMVLWIGVILGVYLIVNAIT